MSDAPEMPASSPCDENGDTRPTTLAVAEALHRTRLVVGLSVDELSYVVERMGHPMPPERIDAIEHCRTSVTVDDLMALCWALDESPSVILSFIPDIRPPHDPLASGVPHNVEPNELEAWVRGDRFVSRRDRAGYWAQTLERLNNTLTHLNDQLDAIQEEFRAELDGSKPRPDETIREHREDVYRQLQETFVQYETHRIVAEDTLRNILGLPGLAEDPGPR